MRCFLLPVAFGVAASALFGCSGEQDARTTPGGSGGGGGSSAGMGGGTGAMGGGSAAGMGGSNSVVMEPDAGGEAGAAGAAGSGGFTYPAGCPVPNPIGIPGQTVAIQSFNFLTSEVVLKNISSSTQTIEGERLGWQWCSFPSYWNIAPQGDVVLPPGKTYKFILINNTQGTWPLPPEGSELAIYVESGTFDEPEKMVSFVSWGTGLPTAGREYVATLANLWTYQDRVEMDFGDGFIATGNVKLASGYTSVPRRCLVAPENGE